MKLNLNSLQVKDKKYILSTYNRYPLVFVRGKGVYLWDSLGRKYLDFFTGISVNNFGHRHPLIIKAINQQISRFTHLSNWYYSVPQVRLAEKIIKKSFPGKVFFSNSGAEANESAIKLVRKYGRLNPGPNNLPRYDIITFKNSFHGRTMATISATGQKKIQSGFEPLLPGFKYAEFNNLTSVQRLINSKTVAIMVEPVQGEGGVYPATLEFLAGLRNLCNQYNLILIYDEIQCGLGRIGTAFAFQHYKIQPEIMTLAKSIAAGLPLGVTVVTDKISNLIKPGDHGSTFGGNPVACAAANVVLDLLTTDLYQHIRGINRYFITRLQELKAQFPFIHEVRGLGLMLGLELTLPGRDIVLECINQGLLINCTAEKVLRFLPPLIISKKEIDRAIQILYKVLPKFSRKITG